MFITNYTSIHAENMHSFWYDTIATEDVRDCMAQIIPANYLVTDYRVLSNQLSCVGRQLSWR